MVSQPHAEACRRHRHASTLCPGATCPRWATGLSGCRLPISPAAARTATSPPSSPACVTAATSLCPSTRAAASSREAVWTSAWGPQVRPPGPGPALLPRPVSPLSRSGGRHPRQPWQAAREASKGAGGGEAGCPLGPRVTVIVLIPASRADRAEAVAPPWLLLGWAWSGRGHCQLLLTEGRSRQGGRGRPGLTSSETGTWE